MIDFSDPKTDVQDMLNDFKKFIYNEYNEAGRFNVVALSNWINRKYHTYRSDYQLLNSAKELISVWLSCGLIRDGSTRWTRLADNNPQTQNHEFRIYYFKE
jgi:hypothetical protein